MTPDAVVRTLCTVLAMSRLGERMTVRTVAVRRGVSVTTAHKHLSRLAAEGLVEYGSGRQGVIAPLVERVA